MSKTDRTPEVFPVGHFIREELHALGWTQGDFAAIVGTSNATISRIMTGKRRLTAEMAVSMGTAISCDPSMLMALEAGWRIYEILRPPGDTR